MFPFVYFTSFFSLMTFAMVWGVESIPYTVVSKIPHEPPAFTQGLKIIDDQLYESSGLYGQSCLKQIDIKTGRILKKIEMAPEYYAEGIACFSSRIIQLTWKEGVAFVYERPFLRLQGTKSYLGDGWGLCADGNSLWMSDGSSILTQRNPETFAILRRCFVESDGKAVYGINDLECVDDNLYANILFLDKVIRIDKKTGFVTGIIHLSSLLTMEEKAKLDTQEVLNGIAYYKKNKTFFVTGKNWPWIFEIRLSN